VVYYGNPCSEEVRAAMRAGLIGYIDTPKQGNKREPGLDWIADNGCFSSAWNDKQWWSWVSTQPKTMRFATAPDVVSDWQATLERFEFWQPVMAEIDLPIACVAQDGAEVDEIPWDRIAAVFIGGSTEWKLSKHSEAIIAEANRRKTWAHVGRVNSLKRMRWAKQCGADSVDGTMLTFAPSKRLPQLLRWLQIIHQEETLWPNGSTAGHESQSSPHSITHMNGSSDACYHSNR